MSSTETNIMVLSIIAMASIIAITSLHFYYKAMQLKKLRDSYYEEISQIYNLTRTAAKRSNEEIINLTAWVNTDLAAAVNLMIMTHPDLVALTTKYNMDDKKFLLIFNKISNDLTQLLSDRFSETSGHLQKIYHEEFSKLLDREDKNVSKK